MTFNSYWSMGFARCCVNVLSLSLLIGLSITDNAFAELKAIEGFITQGRYVQALELTNENITREPDNVTYQFMKGIILTRQDNLDEAEQVFISLTRSHPELPEPFNNLAVIYAAQGEFDKARDALQQAINTHPSYATAHENMGDIYAKMASHAYNQALELDRDNTSAREKLSLVSSLSSLESNEEAALLVVRQEELREASAQLAGLQKALADAEHQTRMEKQRVAQSRQDLADLQQEKERVIEAARVEQLKVKEEADMVAESTMKTRQELQKLEQMATVAIEEAKKRQQIAIEEANAEQKRVDDIKQEIVLLTNRRNKLIEEANLEQERTETLLKSTHEKTDAVMKELAQLEQRREALIQQEEQDQQRAEILARQAEEKVEQARQELALLEQEHSEFMQQSQQEQQEAQVEEEQTREKVELGRQELALLEQRKKDVEDRIAMESEQSQQQLDQLKDEITRLQQQRQQIQDRAVAAVELQQTMSVNEEPVAIDQGNDEQQKQDVINSVNLWANYWSEQDVDGYLSSYSRDFLPDGGLARNIWVQQRRQRLTRPAFIRVSIDDVEVNFVGPEYAQVQFSQRYQSDTYSDRVVKSMLMKQDKERWLIVEEKSL